MSSKSKNARKTKNRKPAGTTLEGKTCLVSGNRKQFIADHDWAQPGMSVLALSVAVLRDGQKLVKPWAIGPRNTERVAKGATPLVAEAKPAKKAKAKKTATVAKVTKAEPAKVFRRANGTIAPKTEYAVREVLEAQGLTRKQVDKRTAKAMKALA